MELSPIGSNTMSSQNHPHLNAEDQHSNLPPYLTDDMEWDTCHYGCLIRSKLHASFAGINQMVAPIASRNIGIKGNVKKCYKATTQMKAKAKAALEEAKGKVEEVKFEIECREGV